ncbi:hypothetical protein OG349_08525 [Streptomyces sp. NBC_01317]|uniref:hypothetical protein n=1 Tax=Streptomyces sp. NBC_01317 TaxID=2903822 RepID=UPI002E0F6680|nr:hypothetical protein OG349_08525 [Streptomyces sp. NBC_01317]
MRIHRRAVAMTAAAAVALATVSCGVSDSRPVAGKQPTTEYGTRPLTEQDKDLLHDAEESLTRSCMASRGFKTWVVPRKPLPEDREFPYVIDDVPWASAHGYGSDIRARRDQLRVSDPNRRYFGGLSPRERERALDALHGEPSARRLEARTPDGATLGRVDGGCTALAQKRLYGDLAVWFRVTTVTDALNKIRYSQVTADTDYADSIRKWSACMRERGSRYADPHEARAAFLDPDKAVPRVREIRTAVTEAECAISSGLSDTARRLDRRYGERLRHEYADEVLTRRRLEAAALERGRSTVRNERDQPDQPAEKKRKEQ